MTAADRLNEIEARANAATKGPWGVRFAPTGIRGSAYAWVTDSTGMAALLERHNAGSSDDVLFASHARTDVPALVAALRAVLELHREARNDAKLTPPCDQCHGEPGTHPCGCWADERWPTVCAVCTDPRHGYHLEYPCPTVRAIEEALS